MSANEFDSAREVHENIRAIQATPAFQKWKEILEAQINGRRASALEPIVSTAELQEHNYRSGEAVGMMAAVSMWDLMREGAKTTIDSEPTEEGGDK